MKRNCQRNTTTTDYLFLILVLMMALEDINKNNSVLPNYDLKTVLKNGMCKSDVVMKAFIDIIMNKAKSVIGFLGKMF